MLRLVSFLLLLITACPGWSQMVYSNLNDSLTRRWGVREVIVDVDSAVGGYVMQRDTSVIRHRWLGTDGLEYRRRALVSDVYYLWYDTRYAYLPDGRIRYQQEIRKPEQLPQDAPTFLGEPDTIRTWYYYRDGRLRYEYRYLLQQGDSLQRHAYAYTHDSLGRKAVVYKLSPTFPFEAIPYLRYHYDEAGRMDTLFRWLADPQTWAVDERNHYNEQGQLLEVHYELRNWHNEAYTRTHRYRYDERGNRIIDRWFQDGALSHTVTYRYNEKGLIVEEASFDAAGNFQYRFVTTYRYADE